MLGTIEIPKIGVVKDLYSGITMPTLDKGPGYWPGTALPGELGNTVVAGHRTSKDRPFERLDELVPGDEIIFTTGSGRHVYAVTSTEIVTPDALWIVDQTHDHRATLFACHPPGSVAYRIVVHADLVDSSSESAQT
jgi:sortase A